ncbi:MAG: anti-sigma factor antagonist [Clostridia bacterium]|nr:anti-sigma factor antagonist [Clostridia bacterium]
MKFSSENGVLTLFAEGKIDSTNAEAVSAEIESVVSSNQFESLVLDIDKLSYISSAGLRVVLKYKKAYDDFKVVNASTEIYDIFEMTGFTEMMTVEKAFRTMSVDGCQVIGMGAKGTVYRYNGDTIIKVYKNPDSLPDIKNERELARRAFILGIPTAISYDIVKVGNSYGSVFELLDAKSYSQLIVEDPDNTEKYVTDFANLLKTIHSTKVKAEDMPSIKHLVLDWLDKASSVLSASTTEKLKNIISQVPDELTMLHCDYHTNNVMSQKGETLLIDMDTLSHGHPIFDLANVYITYVGFGVFDPTMVEKFLGMPYNQTVSIWNTFISKYLNTTDPEEIKKVEDKVKLVSDVRSIRHFVRRGDNNTEDGMKKIQLYIDEIESLLEHVDSVVF